MKVLVDVLHYSTKNHVNNRWAAVINSEFSGSRYDDGHEHWSVLSHCVSLSIK